MRIGIDAHWLVQRQGQGNHVASLLDALVDLKTAHEFVVYLDEDADAGALESSPGWTLRRTKHATWPVYEQAQLPRLAARDDLDVLHCPTNTAPLRGLGRVQTIVTVHDVMFMLPPQIMPTPTALRQRFSRRYRAAVVPRAARRAARILAISDSTRRDVVDRMGIDASKVRLAPSAARAGFVRPPTRPDERLAEIGVAGPYILAMAAVDPRKNLHNLLAAVANLPDAPELMLVGPHRDRQQVMAQVSAAGVRARWLGFVEDATLAALYERARVFVYPSLYEGFGLPVLEAMSCGGAVVTSDRSSLPEVAGDAAVVVDPRDPVAIRRGIERAMIERAALVARGRERASHFSWRASASALVAACEEIA